jgi:hypothetical protein
MDVEFQLTPEDLPALTRYHQQLHPLPEKNAGQWIWLGLLAGVVALFILSSRFGVSRSEEVAFFLGCFFAGGGLLVLLLLKYQAALRRQKHVQQDQRNRDLYEPKRMTISPDGVTVSGSRGFTLTRWPFVWHIGRSPDYAFLYITSETAYVVPRRAFRDEQQFAEFIALAQQFQRSYSPETPKPTGILAALPPQTNAITHPPHS